MQLDFKFCALLGLVLSLTLATPAPADEESFKEIRSALKALRGHALSPGVFAKIRNYAVLSSSPQVLKGLEYVLQSGLQTRKRREQRAMRQIRLDGNLADWGRHGMRRRDQVRDIFPIDQSQPMKGYSAFDDIQSFGFLSSDREIMVALQPRKTPPRGRPFYYAMNLLSSAGTMYYAVSWNSSNTWLQIRDPADGSFVRSVTLGRSRAARGAAFEARIPLRMLRNLPEQYQIEPVSFNEARNTHDNYWHYDLQGKPSHRLKNYALELLVRYAEHIELVPDDPWPLVQALVDAYVFKMAAPDVKELVVNDGLEMIRQAKLVQAYTPGGLQPLNSLGFDEMLVWADRSQLFATDNVPYKFRDSLRRSRDSFDRELYRFRFLAPETLDRARQLAVDHQLLKGTAQETFAAIEGWLAGIQRYRADLSFFQKVYEANPEYWQRTYDEILWERDHQQSIITTVSDVPIHNYWNYSPSFQTDYLAENGFFYGNCVDVTALGLTIAKALGVPALHLHYEVVASNYRQTVHSFPAYYESQRQRYLSFRPGYNQIWSFARSGKPDEQVLFFAELPIAGSSWESESKSTPDPAYRLASNSCSDVISEEAWRGLDEDGFEPAYSARCPFSR